MRRHSTVMAGSHLLLAALVITAACDGHQQAAAQSSNFFPLHGTLRDFHRTDPNFAVAPSGGNGHYAGNLALMLPANERPLFIGGGGKVMLEWLDQFGRLIAPNMMIQSAGGGSVPVIKAPVIRHQAIVDTYNPALGPYDPTNPGPAPEFNIGAAMPTVTVPDIGGATCSLPKARPGKPVVLNHNMRCTGDVHIGTNMHLRVVGNVTIVCDGAFILSNKACIEVTPGSTLSIYARNGVRIKNNSRINMDSEDSARVLIHNVGSADVVIANAAQVCARIISPSGTMYMQNAAQFYGRIAAYSLDMRNSAQAHIEGGTTICGVEPNDVAGAYEMLSSGGIPSPMAFSTWFDDVPGINMSKPHTITLQRAFSGTIWQYNSVSFYPADGQLFGNQGQIHNNYFTFTSKIRFTHRACTGRYFEYIGTDDAWLFVNGQLAMDHGGVRMPATPHHVEFDRLGLVDGQQYIMHLFIAQRNPVASTIRIRTNLELIEAMAH